MQDSTLSSCIYCKYCILKVTTTKCSCPVCYPAPLSEDDGVGKCQKVRSTTGNCPSTSYGGFCETCNSENRVEAFCQSVECTFVFNVLNLILTILPINNTF